MLAPLGSGADYWVSVEGESEDVLAEVSGIRSDGGGQLGVRLSQKTGQIFTDESTRVGFVSVTAFSTDGYAAVRGCLHFVNRRRHQRQKRKRKPGPKRR